jgi:hypothetical protein
MTFLAIAGSALLIVIYLLVVVTALPFSDQDSRQAHAIEGGLWLPPH